MKISAETFSSISQAVSRFVHCDKHIDSPKSHRIIVATNDFVKNVPQSFKEPRPFSGIALSAIIGTDQSACNYSSFRTAV